MIPGLKDQSFTKFIGKNTNANLADMEPTWLVTAKNIMLLGDGQPRKAPGYTLITSGLGDVKRVYDFQRDFDRRQFLIVQNGSKITAMTTSGGNQQDISTGESSAKYAFAKNLFALFGSNGDAAHAWMDNSGTLTKYSWGISAPEAGLAISQVVGTLSLQFGRMYVYCGVRYVTDHLGNTRMHIGAPSPFSGFSGPITSQANVLSGLTAVAGEAWSHFWIFATVDTAENTSNTYNFAAEVPVGTSTWADDLPDSQLDDTRLAPWQNYPAPPASILATYQNRIVAINTSTGLIQMSGYEEIDLGIPEMAFPATLFFEVPSGTKAPTGAIVSNKNDTQENALFIGTQKDWSVLTGSNATDFSLAPHAVSYGPTGKQAVCKMATGHIAWLGIDKRIRIYNGISGFLALPVESIDISSTIGPSGMPTTYGMEDLSTVELANCEMRAYSLGSLHFLVVFGNTSDVSGQGFNWVQLWFVNVNGPQIQSMAETDLLPLTPMSATSEVLVNSSPFIFMGDVDGNLYRWPDGYQHNGQDVENSFSPTWTGAVKSRCMFADIQSDVTDAIESMSVSAVTTPQPDNSLALHNLGLRVIPDEEGTSSKTIRADMQAQGVAFGRWTRLKVTLPPGSSPASVQKLTIWRKPIFAAAP